MNVELIKNFSYVDQRGEFLRIYDSAVQELENLEIRQVNVSINPKSLTLRGMHYQVSGPPEHKFITVLSGDIELVVSNAHTVSESSEIENQYFYLSEETRTTLLVPSGLATGWISLSDDVRVSYLMTSRFQDCEFSGFCFNDSFAEISWSFNPKVISEKDLRWAPLR